MTTTVDDGRSLLWAVVCVKREAIQNFDQSAVAEAFDGALQQWIEAAGDGSVTANVCIWPVYMSAGARAALRAEGERMMDADVGRVPNAPPASTDAGR